MKCYGFTAHKSWISVTRCRKDAQLCNWMSYLSTSTCKSFCFWCFLVSISAQITSNIEWFVLDFIANKSWISQTIYFHCLSKFKRVEFTIETIQRNMQRQKRSIWKHWVRHFNWSDWMFRNVENVCFTKSKFKLIFYLSQLKFSWLSLGRHKSFDKYWTTELYCQR